MNINWYSILALAILSFKSIQIHAQISPGDLAASHLELEGIFNCTKCHTLGEKVSNAKCMDCHKEINNRIKNKQGYHASKEVKGKDCFECHSDHHGRTFEMVRFDEDAFNHNWTGYELTGAHKTTDCRTCHQADNIQEAKYKSDKKTFLGLKQTCISCHQDVHQNTLSTQNCTQCHNTKTFSPAEKFEHSKTDFALFGKHAQLDCIECHKKERRNGADFQFFSGIKHGACTDCHQDPHQSNLGNDCKKCHTEKAWSNFIGKNRFDHNQTNFPLKGQHKQVDCAGCHDFKASPKTLFQDNIGLKTSNCVECHKDVHEGKFGQNCAECHTEESFRIVGNTENFNHSMTDFPLEGKHLGVDCRKCHTSDKLTEAIAFEQCVDCHKDYHEGQFLKKGIQKDCASCHAVTGFEETTYGFDEHARSDFPLDGAHLATPCFACHVADDSKWVFRDLGNRCVDCHTDIHQGEISEKFYPNQDCTICHETEAWNINKFDHGQTKFKLEGVHAKTTCSDCHKPSEEKPYGTFLQLTKTCVSCHENIHGTQFLDKKGAINCAGCHGFADWTAPNFDHDKTQFKLTGKHAEVECAACHKKEENFDSDVVLYKIPSFECSDCHQ